MSGNQNVDELIKNIQLNSSSYQEIIEWIPEKKLRILNCIGKGRFGTVYKAIWKDGYIGYWNDDENRWERYEENCIVAVKVLNKSKNIKSDLLNQVYIYIFICLFTLNETEILILIINCFSK